MLYYFLACICSILSYDLARSLTTFESTIPLFQDNQLPMETLHMFWYVDIMILFVVSLGGLFAYKFKGINVYNPRFYLNNRKVILLLAIPVLAANLKSVLSGNATGDVITSYSLFTPFVVCILSYYLFKERLPKVYILAFLVATLGFILTKVGSKHSFNLPLNSLLLLYVFINAASTIAIRYASLSRGSIEGIVIENLFYALQGLILFYLFGNFKWQYLFTWQVLLVALPSLGHHILVILGNQASKYTAGLILIDFTKVGMAYLSTFIFFGRSVSSLQILGVTITCFAVATLKNKFDFRGLGNRISILSKKLYVNKNHV